MSFPFYEDGAGRAVEKSESDSELPPGALSIPDMNAGAFRTNWVIHRRNPQLSTYVSHALRPLGTPHEARTAAPSGPLIAASCLHAIVFRDKPSGAIPNEALPDKDQFPARELPEMRPTDVECRRGMTPASGPTARESRPVPRDPQFVVDESAHAALLELSPPPARGLGAPLEPRAGAQAVTSLGHGDEVGQVFPAEPLHLWPRRDRLAAERVAQRAARSPDPCPGTTGPNSISSGRSTSMKVSSTSQDPTVSL